MGFNSAFEGLKTMAGVLLDKSKVLHIEIFITRLEIILTD
jgi:hypothetical protein